MEKGPEFEGECGLSWRSTFVASLVSLFVGVSSAYIAVFLSGLPWPIILSVVLSYTVLRALDTLGRRHNEHETNVAQAGGSVGGLIAAGVAFTIPAYLVLSQNFNYALNMPPLYIVIVISVVGALLGIALSLPVRRITIDEEDLPFPSGYAGAEVLLAIERREREARLVLMFGVFAAIFTAISRGILGIGKFSWEIHVLSVVIIVELLPLLVAVGAGYIMGPSASFSWFLGAVVGWVIVMPILQTLGFVDFRLPVFNFGMGIVLGAGLGFFFLKALPRSGKVYKAFLTFKPSSFAMSLPLALSVISYFVLVAIGVHPLGALLGVIGAWIMSSVAGKTTGETNIDPLEQFGLFVGLFAMYFLAFIGVTMDLNQAILLTAFVSIASALAGDIGHDFKSAKVIGTRPIDITYGDMVASIVGGIVAPLALVVILRAHPEVLSLEYPTAAQSKLVALALAGEIYPEFFVGGILIGLLIETIMAILERKGMKRPPLSTIAFGVGVFLGFSLAILIAVGGAIRILLSRKGKRTERSGILAVSGIMGGEGIVGFILALIAVINISLLMPASVAIMLIAIAILIITEFFQ